MTTAPTDPHVGRSGSRNAALDGLRGLAVLAVVLRHLDVPGFGGGGTGVFLFFVLSGFLITELLYVERRRTGRVALGAFWMRRAVRLLPALAVAVVLSVVLAAVLGDDPGRVARQSLPAVLYVANWWRVHELTSPHVLPLGPFEHTWSLSVEEQFYLVWPVLFLGLVAGLRRPRPVAAATAVLVAASVVDRLLVWDPARPLLSAALVYNRTDTEAVLLLTGAVAAVVMHAGPRRRPLGRRAWAVVVTTCVAVLVALGGGQPLGATRHLELWWVAGVATFGVAAAVLCVAVVRAPECTPARLLAWRPLVAVGRVSYGVYLYHYPLAYFLLPRVGGAAGDVLVLGCTAAVATASWMLVERPLLRAHRRRTPPPARLGDLPPGRGSAPAAEPRRARLVASDVRGRSSDQSA